MSTLGQMFAASTATLKADLARLRAGQSHAASKGSSAEEALRELLRQHLPASIGITSGQVADSSGAMSKQVDAILYDAARTPMIFQSPDGGVRTVPAEGVLACIEIKTHLRSDMLSGILENCHSVKSLERSAFVPQHVAPEYRAYDRSWTDLPIHYSVFAFESDGTYSAKLNELQRERALHERIDLVCYLEHGVSLNGFLVRDDDPTSLTWSPTSTSFGGLMDADTDNALLVWFLLLSSYVTVAPGRPINLVAYAHEEISLSATLQGSKPETDAMRDALLDAEARRIGMPPASLKALADHAATSPEPARADSGEHDLLAIADLVEAGGQIEIVNEQGQTQMVGKEQLPPEELRRLHARLQGPGSGRTD